jgi:hypothetical protein
MTSTFRLLLAAMPDIAQACERISDQQLRDRAFDVLVQAARDGGELYTGAAVAPDTSYSGFAPTPAGYDPSATRIDNGALRG